MITQPKRKFTVQQLLTFQNAAREWLSPPRQPQTQPEVNNYQNAVNEYNEKIKTLLADAIVKISPDIATALKPLQDLQDKFISESKTLLLTHSDEHHIEQTNTSHANPNTSHRHIFKHTKDRWWKKGKDSYKEFIEAGEKLKLQDASERKKILESEIEITPMYAEQKPSFKLFPPEIQNPFKGIVIPTDEESERDKLMKK